MATQQRNQMIINKSETEYNMRSIRFLLLTITTMFIVIGILMMLLGISVYSYYHNFSYIYESAKSGHIFTPAVMCVFLGFILLVISSFGFFGSLKQSTCAVNFYALILTLMLILKLVLVILAFTTDPKTIAKYIYVPVEEYTMDREVEVEIDALQVSLNCCGAYWYTDYTFMFMENSANYSIVLYHDDVTTTPVPRSCCSLVGQDNSTCERVRTPGCKTALVNVIKQNSSVLGVLGVSVMFIELLGIIFALLLARCIRKVKSERAFMAWKIREQLILARQEERKQLDSMYITPQETSTA